MDDDVDRLSIPQQIKNRCLNMTIGPWMRCVELVLAEYQPRSSDVEEEAERVVKLALLLMLTRYYDEEQIVMLLDSTSLSLPKKLSRTSKFDLARIIDNVSSDEQQIVDPLDDDEDAPPHDTGGTTRIIQNDESGEVSLEDN